MKFTKKELFVGMFTVFFILPSLAFAALPPVISKITPNQGTSDTVVTIFGTNFIDTLEITFENTKNELLHIVKGGPNYTDLNGVYHNDDNVAISPDGTSLKFSLESFFANDPGLLNVRVSTLAGTSNAVPFTLLARSAADATLGSVNNNNPVLPIGVPSSLIPDPNKKGVPSTIYVQGANIANSTVRISREGKITFGPKSTIYFDNKKILPTSQSNYELTFFIPAGTKIGTHKIQVGEKGSSARSNAVLYQVKDVVSAVSEATIGAFASPSIDDHTYEGTINDNYKVGGNIGNSKEIDFSNESNHFIVYAKRPYGDKSYDLEFSLKDVPTAKLIPGIYKMHVVTVRGNTNDVQFTLKPVSANTPVISKVVPDKAQAPWKFTIYGENLPSFGGVELFDKFDRLEGVTHWSNGTSPTVSPSLQFDISDDFAKGIGSNISYLRIATEVGVSNPLPFTFLASTLRMSWNVCLGFKNALKLSSKDAKTNNEVSALQNFLYYNDFLSTKATGVFGSTVQKALRKFQKIYGLEATGTLNTATRLKIKTLTCNSGWGDDKSQL